MNDHLQKIIDLVGQLPETQSIIPELLKELSAAHQYKENRDFISLIGCIETVLFNLKTYPVPVSQKQAKIIQKALKLGFSISYEQYRLHTRHIEKAGFHILPIFEIDFNVE